MCGSKIFTHWRIWAGVRRRPRFLVHKSSSSFFKDCFRCVTVFSTSSPHPETELNNRQCNNVHWRHAPNAENTRDPLQIQEPYLSISILILIVNTGNSWKQVASSMCDVSNAMSDGLFLPLAMTSKLKAVLWGTEERAMPVFSPRCCCCQLPLPNRPIKAGPQPPSRNVHRCDTINTSTLLLTPRPCKVALYSMPVLWSISHKIALII